MAENQTQHNYRIDLLRILACFSVVILHVASQEWYTQDVSGGIWFFHNFYDAIFRFGVPVFVMISGMLFLNPAKDISLKKLYTHNIAKLLIIFLVWSGIYGIANSFLYTDIPSMTLIDYVKMMIKGSYHLWYLPMLIFLYMLIPLLRLITKHGQKKACEYILALFFLLFVFQKTLLAFPVSPQLDLLLDAIFPEMITGYAGYFILGHYLTTYDLPVTIRKAVYMLTIPALLGAVVISTWISHRLGAPSNTIYDSYALPTVLVSTTVFLLFTQGSSLCGTPASLTWKKSSLALVREVSSCTLGIYLIHLLVIAVLWHYGYTTLLFSGAVSIPLLSAACFGISLISTMLLRRLPLIGKYIC